MARSNQCCGFGLGEVSSARPHTFAIVVLFVMVVGIEGVGIKRRMADMEQGEEESVGGAASSAGHASSSSSSAPKVPKKSILTKLKAADEPSREDSRGPIFERLKKRWADGEHVCI